MQRSLLFRLTALVMCCALIFMCSPVRAEAMTMSSFLLLFGDDVLNLILAICKGLGVTWTTLELADRAVQGIMDDMQSVDYLWTDGGIQVLHYIGSDGVPRNGISLEMIEWVQTWLFDKGVVNYNSVPEGYTKYNDVILRTAPVCSGSGYDNVVISYNRVWESNNSTFKYVIMYIKDITGISCFSSSTNPTGYGVLMNKPHYIRYYTADKWDSSDKFYSGGGTLENKTQYEIVWTSFDIVHNDTGEVIYKGMPAEQITIEPAEGVELGQVADPSLSLSEGYEKWHLGAATVGDSVYYPVTMGPTLEDTLSQTQEHSWTGVTEFEILAINCSYKSDAEDGEVYLGSTVQLLANVAGNGVYTSQVTWSWYEGSGPLSSTTALTADGVVTIGLDETATFLTAKAVSVADPTKFGTVTISLTLTEAPAIPTTPVDSLGNTDVGTFIGNITGSIVDGISSLFIPSVEIMAAQQVKWGDLVATRFGAMAQAGDLIGEVVDTFQLGEKQEYIEIPGVTVTFGDVPWTFGPFKVKVIPEGLEFVVVSIQWVTNIGCTLLFANALKRRYERIMEG